jgi:hypothetical protein
MLLPAAAVGRHAKEHPRDDVARRAPPTVLLFEHDPQFRGKEKLAPLAVLGGAGVEGHHTISEIDPSPLERSTSDAMRQPVM